FFSSRRRHTSFSRDWSSDVCSSDLAGDVSEIDMAGKLRRNAFNVRQGGAAARLTQRLSWVSHFNGRYPLAAIASVQQGDRLIVLDGFRLIKGHRFTHPAGLGLQGKGHAGLQWPAEADAE